MVNVFSARPVYGGGINFFKKCNETTRMNCITYLSGGLSLCTIQLFLYIKSNSDTKPHLMQCISSKPTTTTYRITLAGNPKWKMMVEQWACWHNGKTNVPFTSQQLNCISTRTSCGWCGPIMWRLSLYLYVNLIKTMSWCFRSVYVTM